MSPANKNRREHAYARAVELFIKHRTTLNNAVSAVRGGITVSTLQRRVAFHNGTAGYAARGAPITKEELAALVQELYGSSSSVASCFVNEKPGK
eukprot:IDg2293t1